MLSPVSTAPIINPVAAQRDGPVVTQALAALSAVPDAAIALALAASSEVEGKLNMLLIAARERMIDSLFAVVDAVSQSLAMQQDSGESNVGYAVRLAQAINDLTPSQLASVQQQLNAQGQTAPLALVARALQNPAGNEAAQVVAYMEVVRYKEKDLATKAVVASYGQNGAEEPEAAPAPQTLQQSISGNAAGNAATAPSKLPMPGAAAPQAADALPPTPEESASTASAGGSQAPAPPVTALPLQTVAGFPKLPVATSAAVPTASAAPSSPEMPTTTVSATPQPASALSLPLTSAQAASALPATAAAVKDDSLPASLAQFAEAKGTPVNLPGSAAVPLPAAANPAPVASLPISTNSPLTTRPTNTPAAASQAPLATVSQHVSSSLPSSPEATDPLPVIAAIIEDAVQPAQILPQPGAKEVTFAPQPQQQTAPSPPGSAAPSLSDFKGELKVVVDRLVSAIGAELLQTMAEVEPVAEKIVAQALVADMLDSAELGTLPSPDETVSPARAAATSVPTAPINDNPVEELSSLIALNQMLKDAAPAAQSAALQQPLPTQFPVGVPFAVAQYLPAENVIDDNDSPHIDRVDAVDDEEHEREGGKRGEEAEDEAAKEQQESDEAALVAFDEIEADDVPTATVDLKASRPLALPRPAPMEPAFNLYQRMGGWE